jgi:hypothetical protein
VEKNGNDMGASKQVKMCGDDSGGLPRGLDAGEARLNTFPRFVSGVCPPPHSFIQ